MKQETKLETHEFKVPDGDYSVMDTEERFQPNTLPTDYSRVEHETRPTPPKREIKSVGFFELIFFESNFKDKIILTIGLICSLASGCVMPLFSLLFGDVMNKFTKGENDLIPAISNVCLNFVYTAIGMFFAGLIMVWVWTYYGKEIVKKLKEHYFRAIMRQNQTCSMSAIRMNL
jgi:hypothetical protein